MSVPSLRPPAAIRRFGDAIWLSGILVVAVAVGALVTLAPVVVSALCLAGVALAVAVRFPDAVCRVLGLGMAGLLAGYAAFGRGFAHLGVPPVYVGEMVLGLGLMALMALLVRRRLSYPATPVLWILLGFMLWGLVRTVPYIASFRADALRDAVLWGYGAFVLLLLPHLLARGRLEQVGEIYGRWAPLILVWLPVGLVFSRLGGEFDNVLKAGDVGVHLGGLAAYQLLQLRSGRAMSPVRTTLLAAAWLVTFALVAGTNRGGTLSALAAILIVAVTTRGKVARQLAGAAFLAVFVGTVLVATDVSIDLGFGRRFSASQIVANLQSVTGKSRDEGLEGTRRWRLQWWGEIVDYTVYGPYFWQGKGFGVNLASADGIEDRTGTLRSPHNGHLTVLARSGVPGLALWLLLQGAFAATLLRARHRARRMGEERVARMLLWVLAYWMAMLINATFDVYLEGPQGGIWYWSLMAAGIALAARVPRPEASTRVTRRHS